MQAYSVVSPSDELPPTVDRDWLEELRKRLDHHGARSALARALGVDPSQISKLAAGTQAPAHLVVGASRHLGMMLPKTWFDDREYRVLTALRRAQRLAAEAGDDKRRQAVELMLDSLTEDIESSADDLVEHVGALIRTHVQRRRPGGDDN